jgi:hypothetical protein
MIMKSFMKHAALATAFGMAIAPSAVLTAQAGAGDYEFQLKAKLSMEGGWGFSLGAKVQGEPDSIKGKLLLKALP